MRHAWLFGGPANRDRYDVHVTAPDLRVGDEFNIFRWGFGWHVYRVRCVRIPCGEADYVGEWKWTK